MGRLKFWFCSFWFGSANYVKFVVDLGWLLMVLVCF